jgi:protein phosphatase
VEIPLPSAHSFESASPGVIGRVERLHADSTAIATLSQTGLARLPWERAAALKILILSDIHANLEALEAVLAEPRDELWVLGDLANYGPDPCEVVDLVRANATLLVQGNHDYALGAGADPRCSGPFREMASAMQEYSQPLLGAGRRDYLRGLPLTAARSLGGFRFLLCHATPADPLFEYCRAPERWRAEIRGVDADILLTGHTHLPLDIAVDRVRILNPGSVGQPKHGRPEARYTVWEEGLLSLHARSYDVEKTVGKLLSLPVSAAIRSGLAAVLRSGLSPG